LNTQRINRTDAETIRLVVKNVDGGGSITTGAGVCLVQAGASIDGVSAVNSTAATISGFGGVAKQDIAINGYGQVTAWGYAASVLVSHVGTSITITRGDTLKPGAVAGTFFSSLTNQALSTLLYRYVKAAETPAAVSAQVWIKGFVRGL
jgi:hypothetical protein